MLGRRHERVTDQDYFDLVDQFVQAVKQESMDGSGGGGSNIKYSGLDAEPEMILYEPFQQAAWSSMYLLVGNGGRSPSLFSRPRESLNYRLEAPNPIRLAKYNAVL